MRPTPEPLLYGINDVANVLRISRANVYRMIHDGTLEARRLGGRIVIPAEVVKAFADSLPKFERAPQ
jgi:excisionase family DNA binding protein